MKRKTLAIMFALCALVMVAQDGIKVNYKGSKPTISDFAWAYLSYMDDEDECGMEAINAFREAFIKHRKGQSQNAGEKFIVDEKNGFIVYETKHEGIVDRKEMCYWNEADGKHKLFAFNNMNTLDNGKPIFTELSDITFYRYTNATKKMVACDAPGFKVDYSSTYALPRTGKNIVVTKFNDNGKKIQKTLKWNGRKFTK